MITLYQFPRAFGLPNASLFCMKVEMLLRMGELEYKVVKMSDPRKAPKGKLPYIKDGNELVADSSFILKHLKKKYDWSLDDWLTPEQHATGMAFQALFEEFFYWAIVYSRWVDQRFSPEIMKLFLGKLPWPLRVVAPRMAKKSIATALHGHGIGRHSPEEIYERGEEIIKAISDFLGKHAFLLGGQVSSYDACVMSSLANVVFPPQDTPLHRAAIATPNLKNYCLGLMKVYFPDFIDRLE